MAKLKFLEGILNVTGNHPFRSFSVQVIKAALFPVVKSNVKLLAPILRRKSKSKKQSSSILTKLR